MGLGDQPAVIQLGLDTSGDQRERLLNRMADDGVGLRHVRDLAGDALAKARLSARFNPGTDVSWLAAAGALEAVQRRPYVPPRHDVEEFQSVWSIAQPGRGGDCADLSVLLVSAYRAMGLPARVVWITQAGKPLNHVTAQVFVGGGWQWAESTIRGARLGESPTEAARRLNAWHSLGAPPL